MEILSNGRLGIGSGRSSVRFNGDAGVDVDPMELLCSIKKRIGTYYLLEVFLMQVIAKI